MYILLVEDDPVSMRVLERTLYNHYYDTISAYSVDEAIQCLKAYTNIALIILDIMMPEKDGYELLRYINSNSLYRKMSVLMSTSLGDKYSVLHSSSLGAKDYIVKPISAEILLPKVQALIDRSFKSIMIVCEERTTRKVLLRALENSGFLSVEAESSEEALEILEKRNIHAVISDMEMTGFSGPDLLVEVKDKYPSIRFFFITGYAAEKQKEELIAIGADGYIDKPFNNLEIVRRIAALKIG